MKTSQLFAAAVGAPRNNIDEGNHLCAGVTSPVIYGLGTVTDYEAYVRGSYEAKIGVLETKSENTGVKKHVTWDGVITG